MQGKLSQSAGRCRPTLADWTLGLDLEGGLSLSSSEAMIESGRLSEG